MNCVLFAKSAKNFPIQYFYMLLCILQDQVEAYTKIFHKQCFQCSVSLIEVVFFQNTF